MSDTITTPEALDALPVRSVVLDPHGMAWQKREAATRPRGVQFVAWFAAGVDDGGHDVVARPATVLFRPDAPTPTPAEGVDLGVSGFGLSDDEPTPAGDDQREALARALDVIAGMAVGDDVDDATVTDLEECGWNNALGEVLDILRPLAARPSAPTVTTEQRIALARSCGAVRVGADSVAFYERQGGAMWATFLADADRHLAALGIEVTP